MSDSIVPQGETLSSGWEREVPVDDTLIRRAVLLHASWAAAVPESLGRPFARTERWSGGFVGDRGELTNPIIVTQPVTSAGRFAELLGEVGEIVPPRAPYFLLSPFPTPDLTPYGLGLIGHPPLMVRFPGDAAPDLRPGVELIQVADADTLAVAERVLVEGYPMPDLLPLQPGSILAPPLIGDGTTRVWLALVDGVPAAVAAAHVWAESVLVEYVASLPAARGRGAGAAVTWAATTCRPDLPAFLVASDDGRPLYERMGFVALERWTAWLRPAADSGRVGE